MVCARQTDDAALQSFLKNYVDAFNRQDIDTLSSMWSEQGLHIDRESGQRTVGRAAIRNDILKAFEGSSKPRLSGTITEIRSIKPDVANVEGTTTTNLPNEEPSNSLFNAILVKVGEKWFFHSVDESPVPPPSNAKAALQELSWLEGSWSDEDANGRTISTFRWSPSGSFLIRSISEEADGEVSAVGSEIVGWDPRARQIRSWIFLADGSFGDSSWAKVDNDWIIKSTQTLANGQAASGTYLLTRIDASTVTLKLMGREIDGQPQPTGDAATLVRVSAETSAASPANASPKTGN
jgi:uncharacterized protein (TIGR02246 family)